MEPARLQREASCAFGSKTRSPSSLTGAERGVVVEGTRIAERVGKGETAERIDATFDASGHVVLPGLVNTHHHFYQTLTRAHPSAINKALFPWLVALYPIWARTQAEPSEAGVTARADRAHAFGLYDRRRSSLSLPGRP